MINSINQTTYTLQRTLDTKYEKGEGLRVKAGLFRLSTDRFQGHASFFQSHSLLASKATIPFQPKNIASNMQGVWDVISLLLSSLKNIASNIQVAKNLGFFRVEKELRYHLLLMTTAATTTTTASSLSKHLHIEGYQLVFDKKKLVFIAGFVCNYGFYMVKYLGSLKTKTHLHIILEYVENGSLANIIKPNKFGPFPESLVAVYIAQVLEGLVYLHEQGVIHRDIKGANILTTKEVYMFL
ncbi:hypothetical protein L6452_24501 [Arctium lappa]|uniref:Uncharacterized protein n=1 Tax=Arctium lappa TaxID=4217 RepID=A0ACB9A9G2_ARCLA|nr:hypothetical protein L6452_24501 [Arctium lappa]